MNKLLLKRSTVAGGMMLLGILLVSSLGIFQETHIHSATHAARCPSMAEQHSICPMETLFTMENLQVFSRAVFPIIGIVIAFAALFFVATWFLDTRTLSFLYIKQRHRVFPVPLYGTLFSQGTLHSKAP